MKVQGPITLARDDFYGDWVGLYIGDRLVLEGHSLSGDQVLEALGYEYTTVHFDGRVQGLCPDNLKDLAVGVEGGGE